MLYLPEITPVRIKTERINPELIDPSSSGYYFPAGVGPRVVYLDERYDYPPQTGDDPVTERARQANIWEGFRADGGVWFLDRMAEEEAESRVHEVKQNVFEELGHRHSAEYFERVFSRLFGKDMNVVIISTGVKPFDGNNYHDIGYLR